ncbi:GNAT family N-acetyltransferase [Paenibacillus cremeus]|uniref:GNAT family N-acetyltransferase n=1 Tax=Paenibacillus cremeus TaxID=2163881 RepID=A0A559JZZ7_9BACL|nr:GNAT family N-acetyltransferase [Paenibacillus cremeus]TVY05380.1 GNAT family N-acetyltransferase [Paenibacillus cremeus]
MTVRLLKGLEFKEAMSLANLMFKREGRLPMEAAFPHIYSDVTSHSYGLFIDDRLVSFVGFVPTIVAIGDARLNIYSVGSVCTHPDYVGQGFASKVLQSAIYHAEQAGASLILVSGNRQIYTRAGCYPFGVFAQYRIDSESAAAIAVERGNDTRIRLMNETDLFAVHRLFEERVVRFVSSVWDTAFLSLTVPVATARGYSHCVYVTEQQGKVDAFAVVALKSLDTEHEPFVVEYGGSPEGCAQLFAHVIEEHSLVTLKVVLPVQIERKLGAGLERSGAKWSEMGNSGTIRIVDAKRLLEQASPYLRSKSEADFESLRINRTDDHKHTIVTFKERRVMVTDSELVSLLFDETPKLHDVDPVLIADLKKLFPLPFPYTGGLNYI